MLMLTQTAKLSTFVLLTLREVSPSTASSVPMEHCSTSSTSSVIGGLTSTVLWLSNCIQGTMKSLLRDNSILQLQLLAAVLVMLAVARAPTEDRELVLVVQELTGEPVEDLVQYEEVPLHPECLDRALSGDLLHLPEYLAQAQAQ